MPDFSVVVPTRNRRERLEESVQSILTQEGVDLELIVVDDGSTDDTYDFLTDLASRDDRVHVVVNRQSIGASAARNLGASRARAPLLAFNDDDCVWEREKLKLQRKRMRASGAGVVYCRQSVTWPDLGVVISGRPDAERRGAVRSLVTGNYIGTVAALIDRRLFERAGGFDERLPRLQDWDLWLRLGLIAHFAYVPRVLVRGVAVADGISYSSEALARAASLLLEKWRADGRLGRRNLALLHYGVGKHLLADGERERARTTFRTGFGIDPLSPLNWIGLIGSVLRPRHFNLLKKVRIWLRRRKG